MMKSLAYQAFRMFVEAGIGRSAREVGRKLGKNWSLISRWSSKHRWLERAHAFDARLQHIAQRAEEERIIASAGLWAPWGGPWAGCLVGVPAVSREAVRESHGRC